MGVTRAAVKDGFERYVNSLVSETNEAFRVTRALRGATGPEGAVIDRLLKNSDTVDKRIVQPELREYRDAIFHQFEVVLAYAESEDDFENFADEILARDLYWDSLQSGLSAEHRAEIKAALLDRQRRLGDELAPLVAANGESIWGAAASVYDWERTVELIESHFAFTDPLHDRPDAYRLTVEIDPGDLLGGLARALPSATVDYTDEAIRSMTRAQKRVIDRAKDDARTHFE